VLDFYFACGGCGQYGASRVRRLCLKDVERRISENRRGQRRLTAIGNAAEKN
jgi:hypothetical protein